MSDVTLRRARTEDAEFVYAVRAAALREYVERAGGWNEAEQRRLHERRFAEQDFRVVRLAGRDVGYLASVAKPEALIVNQLCILPEHQGRGLGRRCMERVLEEARARGRPVRLRVMRVNPRARAFYERLGFTQVGASATHVRMTK